MQNSNSDSEPICFALSEIIKSVLFDSSLYFLVILYELNLHTNSSILVLVEKFKALMVSVLLYSLEESWDKITSLYIILNY